MAYWADSGFTAAGAHRPTSENPAAWYVWHFTHKSNLGLIAARGGLAPDATAEPTVTVADPSIKGRRAVTPVVPVDSSSYPRSAMVADHVPWYFAPRSPTLLRVVTGHNLPYQEGHAPLVLLGMRLGDVSASRTAWCYSDRNAAANFVRFGTSVSALPQFIDFELMKVRSWTNTQDDPDRAARRAAEVLVYGDSPIELVSAVVTSNEETLSEARDILSECPGRRAYQVLPSFLYQPYQPRRIST